MIETITERKIISLCEQAKEFRTKRQGGDIRGQRSADITFENWEFKEAQFHLLCNPYSYGDWMFLRDVANRIEEEQNKMFLEHPAIAGGG